MTIVSGEAIRLAPKPGGVEVILRDGRAVTGDAAVLAFGHDPWTPESAHQVINPWQAPALAGVPRGGTVLVQGSGLTMIDYVLALRANGHMGQIYAISRRGLLPRAHQLVKPFPISDTEIPFGTTSATHFVWLREKVREAVSAGSDWRSVVDALRPFMWRLWRELPFEERERFLRHARPWWDVHRHRMAPEVETEIRRLLAADQLRVIAGKISDLEPEQDAILVRFRRRHAKAEETLRVSRIVRCTGVVTDPRTTSNALVNQLLEDGFARTDKLGIGLDVREDCRLIDVAGRASDRLFAIGPVTRAAVWEIIAVPDIRLQCAALVSRLSASARQTVV